jgi:hypothetical protein
VGTGSYCGAFGNNSGIWTLTSGAQVLTFAQGTGDLTFAATAVPEPATCAAIFGGLALAGTIIYRRRQQQRAA